ncbi:Arc family DNA-binding protein [Sinorhizobium meliloti]|uniref:Arc family DNA-binding protein n=1 Tax=Rhizobium meliloti TaxID=382 RepID=UPI0012FE14AF|nr:Arc family DNA-binding protein [Sinorhizobium meliloti]
MARKQAAKDQDKFVVRLPAGMRERIKDKAERAGMSMNEAIVWCLEREFPAPVTLEDRLEELATMVSMLTDSKDTYSGVVHLIAEIEETLDAIGTKGGIPADTKFSDMVRERLDYWREIELDNWRDRNESPFDDANWTSVEEPPEGDPFPNLPDDETKQD